MPPPTSLHTPAGCADGLQRATQDKSGLVHEKKLPLARKPPSAVAVSSCTTELLKSSGDCSEYQLTPSQARTPLIDGGPLVQMRSPAATRWPLGSTRSS